MKQESAYPNLTIGLIVKYQDHVGRINFISNTYLTLCIKEYEERRRDVCILIYRKDWNQILFLNEDEK
jgi:hypothetical protein